MIQRRLNSLRWRLLAACLAAPGLAAAPAYALEHNDAEPSRTIKAPSTPAKTKVILVDNGDGKGGQLVEVPIGWWENPGLIETVDNHKDLPKDVSATAIATVMEYYTKNPMVANGVAKAATEAVEVFSQAAVHDKGEVKTADLLEKVAKGGAEGALSNIPGVKNAIKAMPPGVQKIFADTLNTVVSKTAVGAVATLVKGETAKLPDADKELGKSISSAALEAATKNDPLAKPVIKIAATAIGNAFKQETVSVPKNVNLGGSHPTVAVNPVDRENLPDTVKLPGVAGLPKGLPGGGSVTGQPGGFQPKTPGTPGAPAGKDPGPGNYAGDKNWGEGDGGGGDSAGGRDGDGDTGTAVDADTKEPNVTVEVWDDKTQSWVTPQGYADSDGTQGSGGVGPGGMRDAVANGKHGIGIGSGASGGFNNGDYDALDFVSVSIVEGEWGSVFSSPVGQSGGSSGKGPDAKGNPNPMKPGGSVMNESEIRVWDTQHGGLGFSPAGANPTGFTGGKGSKGPVNDDDKMPNPFDDNSPGGPVSKGAVGASKGGLGVTFKSTGIKKVALR